MIEDERKNPSKKLAARIAATADKLDCGEALQSHLSDEHIATTINPDGTVLDNAFVGDVEELCHATLDRLMGDLRAYLESWQAFDRPMIEILKAKDFDPKIEKYIDWCHENHHNVRKAVQARTRQKQKRKETP